MNRSRAARKRRGLDALVRSTAQSPPSTRRRLGFEPLEDRRLLAVLTVNSTLDVTLAGDGLVTLREAILAANANTTTDLGQKGFGVDTIEFDPVVFGTPQVIGLTLGEIAISQSLVIQGPGRDLLTIDAQQNSRIFNISTSIGDYSVVGLTLQGGKTTGDGGAIRSLANLTVDQCTITGNSANGRGGGIFSGPGELLIAGSTISSNSTAGSFGCGGGVFADHATVSSSTITGNHTAGSSAHGGGLYAVRDLTLTGSTISGNRTLAGGAHGGGFHAYRTTLTDCTVVANSAAGSGGGFLASYAATVIDSSITGNTAMISGGGMRLAGFQNFAGTVKLTHSVVSGNLAADGGGFSAGYAKLTGSMVTNNTANGSGGGFHIAKQGVLQPAAVILVDSTVSGNRAASGGGFYANNGATLSRTTVSDNTGGGIFALYGTVALNSSTVSGNSKAGSGGGIFARYANVTLESSTISGNSATTVGGGIRTYESVTVNSSTVSGNTATLAGGGIYSRQDPLRPYVGTMSINHSTIAGNHSTTGDGGGIWKSAGSFNLSRSILAGNSAAGGSRDLFAGAANVSAKSSLLGDNTGTALAEAQSPDADGNLIGSSAGSGLIDPKLGPLADNGGPTKTHALLEGSPAIDAIPYAVPPLPAHDYELEGMLTDAMDGPELVSLGGTLTSTGYQFGPNQGFNLSEALAAPGQYSLELVFSWDNLSGGWQKIIDFHHLTTDVGVYTAGNGLHFVDRAFAGNVFSPNTFHHLVITRDDATDVVRAFVDGVEAWNFIDAAGDAVFNTTGRIIRLFQDDLSTEQQDAQSGFVDRLRVYDAVLTPTEVAVLANPFSVPAFDQRGEPFDRITNGDGLAGAWIDMGAYEAPQANILSGDFNQDGVVDTADYLVWRHGLGTSFASSDYGVWRNGFGNTAVVSPSGEGNSSATGAFTEVVVPTSGSAQMAAEPAAITAAASAAYSADTAIAPLSEAATDSVEFTSIGMIGPQPVAAIIPAGVRISDGRVEAAAWDELLVLLTQQNSDLGGVDAIDGADSMRIGQGDYSSPVVDGLFADYGMGLFGFTAPFCPAVTVL